MPVSKKRKKGGKPVQRRTQGNDTNKGGGEQSLPDDKSPLQKKAMRRQNPLVANQNRPRGAGRGR